MRVFEFEELKLSVPQNLDEIKNIFNIILSGQRKYLISFINPEIFLIQQKRNYLHEYFMHTDFNFIDGIALIYALNKKLKTKYTHLNRFTGTDFFSYLPERKLKFFFFGAEKEVINKARINIEKEYWNIQITGTVDGYTDYDDKILIDMINHTESDILIVCKGCPLQEEWIIKNYNHLNVKLVFGNGGAFDFWSVKKTGS